MFKVVAIIGFLIGPNFTGTGSVSEVISDGFETRQACAEHMGRLGGAPIGLKAKAVGKRIKAAGNIIYSVQIVCQ